jgi:hypothetical protein
VCILNDFNHREFLKAVEICQLTNSRDFSHFLLLQSVGLAAAGGAIQ